MGVRSFWDVVARLLVEGLRLLVILHLHRLVAAHHVLAAALHIIRPPGLLPLRTALYRTAISPGGEAHTGRYGHRTNQKRIDGSREWTIGHGGNLAREFSCN